MCWNQYFKVCFSCCPNVCETTFIFIIYDQNQFSPARRRLHDRPFSYPLYMVPAIYKTGKNAYAKN